MNVVAASAALLAPTNTTTCTRTPVVVPYHVASALASSQAEFVSRTCWVLVSAVASLVLSETRAAGAQDSEIQARTPRGVGRKPSRLFREMTHTNKSHVLRPTPKVVLEQSKKYAMGALEHFNKRKKIKFELMDVMPVNSMPESCSFYTHVNFTARSSKEGSQEQLFFAELQLCSRRQASSGFIVTCCEPLGPDYTVGHKGFQHDGSVVRKNVDFTRCYACTARMLHPRGEKYIAGHCTIPYIYNSPY